MALDRAEVLACARRAYGDLRNPDYGFFSVALRQRPRQQVVDRIRRFLRVEDWTDRDDAVGFWYEVAVKRRAEWGWSLLLSAVGPYALLVYTTGGLERADVITEARPDGPPQEARIVEILIAEGLTLVSADDVEQTVPEFHPWDGRFPASVFVLLFGDSDVPWWHLE